MIFHRLGLINKNQKGFTLIELIVAMAVTGFITGGITMSIFQLINIEARTSNHMTAVKEVQNAGYWVSHDAPMAQDVDDNDDPGTPELELVTLTWTEWDNTVHQVTYTLQGTELWRDDSGSGQQMRVAQYIDSISCQRDPLDNRKLIVTMTATVGGGWQEASETRTYEVVPRPSL